MQPSSAPTAAPPSGGGGGTAQAAIVIDWGGTSQSSARRVSPAGYVHSASTRLQPRSGRAAPMYISPSTRAITIYVQGQGQSSPAFVTTVPNPCGSGSCPVSSSTSVSVKDGYTTWYAAAYDACSVACLAGTAAGSGTVLALSTTGSGLNVTASGPNNVTISLNGVVSSILFDTSGVQDSGLSHNVNIPVYGVDPDGNQISGSANFANGPIAVLFSDQFGQFTGFPSNPPSFASPGSSGNPIQLTFTGINDCSAAFYGSTSAYTIPSWAGTGTVAAPSVTTTLDTPSTSAYSNPHFGRLTVCWQALSGASQYSLYRGTSAGGESSTALVNFPSNTTLGYQDYTVRNGTTYYYVVCTGALSTSTCSSEFSSTPSGDPSTVAGTGPTYWFDGNDPGTSFPSTWKDKSSNGYNLTVSGFTLVNSGVFNRTYVQAAAGKYAYTASGALSTSPNGLTAVIAASQTTTSTTFERLVNFGYNTDAKGFIGTSGNGTNSGLVSSYWGNTATSGYGHCNGWCDTHYNGPSSTWQWSIPPASNFPSVFVVENDGSCPTYICGSGPGMGGPLAAINGKTMNQDHNGTMTATTGLEIGAYSGSNTGQAWQGTIGDIIIYPTILSNVANAAGTSNNAQQVMEGYEACKWGSQAALPATHPYKLGKPCP